MLLDTDRGKADVLRNLRDRKDLRASRAGTAAVRKHGTVAWSKVKRDLYQS